MIGSLALLSTGSCSSCGIGSAVILSREDDEESLDIHSQLSTREVARFARNDEQ